MQISVLLASNDKEIQEFIRDRLFKSNIQCSCVRESSRALLSILDDDYDYIIVDFKLKGLNGQRVIPLIQKMRPKIPIIYLSDEKNYDNIFSPNIKLRVDRPVNQNKVEEIKKLILSIHN